MSFNPNDIIQSNGNFCGLPFTEAEAKMVLLPVNWDTTVSYKAGTCTAAENIRLASEQLDLYDPNIKDAWKLGIYMRPSNYEWVEQNLDLRMLSENYITFLEEGGTVEDDPKMKEDLDKINQACKKLNHWVYSETLDLLDQGKLVGIVGGEHSVPLGYLKALGEHYESFGILQIDAHCDLRKAYEGFEYSHASIFYNALKMKHITKLVQVGVRDYCEEEVAVIQAEKGRVLPYFDADIQLKKMKGKSFHRICKKIVKRLPQNVYISFDIDGLDPKLCPNTGTPVPSGLQYEEALYLIKSIVDSGRKIIGFDLCEVAGDEQEWDGNVAARLLYKLSNLTIISNG